VLAAVSNVPSPLKSQRNVDPAERTLPPPSKLVVDGVNCPPGWVKLKLALMPLATIGLNAVSKRASFCPEGDGRPSASLIWPSSEIAPPQPFAPGTATVLLTIVIVPVSGSYGVPVTEPLVPVVAVLTSIGLPVDPM
jgi:hypothetical protein